MLFLKAQKLIILISLFLILLLINLFNFIFF